MKWKPQRDTETRGLQVGDLVAPIGPASEDNWLGGWVVDVDRDRGTARVETTPGGKVYTLLINGLTLVLQAKGR